MDAAQESRSRRHKDPSGPECSTSKPLREQDPQRMPVPSPPIESDEQVWPTQPHTILVLLVAISAIFFFAFSSAAQSQQQNVKRGLVAAIFIFLVYAAVQLRSIDKFIVRPHPIVWRISLGAMLLYLMALVFLLNQNVNDARQLLKFLDPRLGTPLPERSYATDCRIYTPENPISSFKNVRDTIFDEFIIAHTVGWAAKTLILRDVRVVLFQSILFEFIEFTFQHWLENFKECWWDHWVLDVVLCNSLGMIVGFYIIKYFRIQPYNWGGTGTVIVTTRTPPSSPRNAPSPAQATAASASSSSLSSQQQTLRQRTSGTSKTQQIITQFTRPSKWTEYHWGPFTSFKRFLYFIIIIALLSLIDTSSFFMKTILWVPPRNPINTYRLLLWMFLAMPGFRELYQFISDPNCKRVGTHAWVMFAIALTELMICIKFGSATDLFQAPFPSYITAGWLGTGVLCFLWMLVFFSVSSSRRNSGILKRVSYVMLGVAFLPLVFMAFPASPDLQWGRASFEAFAAQYLPWL